MEGMTVSYQDTIIDKDKIEKIKNFMDETSYKIDNMITEMENNNEIYDKDVFENQLK